MCNDKQYPASSGAALVHTQTKYLHNPIKVKQKKVADIKYFLIWSCVLLNVLCFLFYSDSLVFACVVSTLISRLCDPPPVCCTCALLSPLPPFSVYDCVCAWSFRLVIWIPLPCLTVLLRTNPL